METLIYNLVFETDLAETQAEIDEFKKRNAEAIEKNRKRLDEDQQWVASHLKEEEHMKHRLRTLRQEDAVGIFIRFWKSFIGVFEGEIFTLKKTEFDVVEGITEKR